MTSRNSLFEDLSFLFLNHSNMQNHFIVIFPFLLRFLAFSLLFSVQCTSQGIDLNRVPDEISTEQTFDSHGVQTSIPLSNQSGTKETAIPDLNIPACEIHRPGCHDWHTLTPKEKRIHIQRHYRNKQVGLFSFSLGFLFHHLKS